VSLQQVKSAVERVLSQSALNSEFWILGARLAEP